ncbi:MAG: hypothetical protein HY834_09060 [Devosia nanyangense]|uniref:Uncharacterized protein n=1 Tax=Devosia nanyangense TaxID=1228055 RepID=A0A933L2K9_9HYPH|nr:hypothetical protein [Devosia nanyangense]
MSLTSDLMAVAETYCSKTGRSPSRIATIIFNDGKKFDLIAGGADLGTRPFERAMAWFAANWPAGVAWPVGIERPLTRPSATLSPEGRGEEEVSP